MRHVATVRFLEKRARECLIWALAACALGLVELGCGKITSVDARDVVQPDDYGTAAGASTLATGAITRFAFAFGGADPAAIIGRNQVLQSGQIADELFATSTNLAEIEWDRRDVIAPSGSAALLYEPLHNARVNLLNAISALESTAPDSAARVGQLFALVGYTEVFLAEGFCGGVMLGHLDANLSPVYGQPLTATQLYQQALADFDSALAHGADSVRILQLARIGRGRALLDMARFAEAAAAVASVPTSYAYDVPFVTGTMHNGVFGNGNQIWYTIPEQEGANGINWRTASDPRVRLVNRSPAIRGLDGSDIWAFVPYQASNAPIRMAGGVEARLIDAEAALQSGNVTSWLAIHNALRATVVGLAPLTDPGTTPTRVDLHFRERAFWLFLTGHRQGDMRRLVRDYGRGPETVFPTGLWREGIRYGTATNLALPGSATNNPNYKGCLDRAA